MREAQRSIVAGTTAGVASILVCHPLDTVRTRLQTAPRGTYASAVDCARQTLRSEGMFALYKGLLWPLLAQGAYKATIFGVYGAAKRFVVRGRANKELRLMEQCLCGGLAGGANALLLTPVELVRNRIQVDPHKTSASKVLRAAINEAGVLGLWRGLTATLCRDVPGVAAYYAGFEIAKAQYQKKKLSTLELAGAGAVGGVAFWTVALPFDHIKSRLQLRNDTSSMLSVLREVLRDGGLPRLYVGYGSAILRGVPGAAIVFSVYSKVHASLPGDEGSRD